MVTRRRSETPQSSLPAWILPAVHRFASPVTTSPPAPMVVGARATTPVPPGNAVGGPFWLSDRPGIGGGGPFWGRPQSGGGGPFWSGSGGGGGGPFWRPATGEDGKPRRTGGAAWLGFHPDLPDRRDRCVMHGSHALDPSLASALEVISGTASRRDGVAKTKWCLRGERKAPARVDLRETNLLSPVEQQGPIGACTAHAVIGLAEYLLRAWSGESTDFSRMFLYKNTRRLLGWQGDTGAYLRTTIKALRLFGVPPELEWPYDGELIDIEPEPYQFAFAQNFRALAYARFDQHESRGEDTLQAIRHALADAFPVVFGFPVYTSIGNADQTGEIPMPLGRHDQLIGGHAVLAVGYDDAKVIAGATDKGALLVRNSWGPEWGDFGYGWLPYGYLTERLATDFWTIFNSDWVKLGEFE